MNYLQAISQVSSVGNVDKTIKTDATNGENTNIDFMNVLKSTVNELNETQKQADEASASIATGTVKDLHQAAITIDKAEINMKLMLEIRNKALNAYKDLIKTQV